MSSYVLPQAQVFQEFELQPPAVNQPLTAVIIGEHFALHRYGVDGDKVKVTNNYNHLVNQCFSWPFRSAGEVVDPGYTRVFMEDALLRYHHNPSGDAETIFKVSDSRIRATSFQWQTANGFNRHSSLLRDVKKGDKIKVTAVVGGNPITLKTTVLDLIPDQLAATIDSTPDADVDNAPNSTVSATSTKLTVDNTVDITTVGTGWNGMTIGRVSESYTLEVITPGAPGTALVRYTSSSGLDNGQVSPVAFGSPTTIGALGLTVTFTRTVPTDEFLVGQTWDVDVAMGYTTSTVDAAGTYTGPWATTYIVTVTRGGEFTDPELPQITVTTTTGVDISGPTSVPDSTYVPVGTRGVTFRAQGAGPNPGLVKGDRFYITVTPVSPGPVRTIQLSENLDSSITTEDLDVTLYIPKGTPGNPYEISRNRVGFAPLVNWTQTDQEVCLNSGIIGYDESWTLGGVPQPLPIEGGKVFVQYRGRLSTYCNNILEVVSADELPGLLGPITPDNPLAFGVSKALLNSNGEPVYALAVCSSPGFTALSLENWLNAIDVLKERDDVYSLVPLTTSKEVQDAFYSHVLSESTPENGRWRIAWFTRPAVEELGIYVETKQTGGGFSPGDPVLATITDDPDISGTQYTYVVAAGEKFVDAGIRPGDVVRALYTGDGFGNQVFQTFVIDQVVNQETLRLVSGPGSAVNVPSKIEVWRNFTRSEVVDYLKRIPGEYRHRRIVMVWPDEAGNNGLKFPGYHVAAALAGLRSGVLPHQGLTNVTIVGFDDLSRTNDFLNEFQLNQLAGSGWWIVVKDRRSNEIISRHQLTTGVYSDILQREQSITTNLDAISYVFLRRMRVYIGKANVTPTAVEIIRGDILGVIDLFKQTLVYSLGPQIIDAKIVELAPDPTLGDRIIARIRVLLPVPVNNIEIHLIVAKPNASFALSQIPTNPASLVTSITGI